MPTAAPILASSVSAAPAAPPEDPTPTSSESLTNVNLNGATRAEKKKIQNTLQITGLTDVIFETVTIFHCGPISTVFSVYI